MGFDKPVGSTIKMGDETLTVIGVCENVVMQDPYKPVGPAIMLLRPYFVSQGFIRLKEGADVRKAMAAIQPVVEKHNPAYPFEYSFTDDEFAKKFSNENQIGQLAGIFAGLSIFISCLGLFGLASFMAERRTKEIGIRKVVGASVFNLWKMLSKDFVILIVISCAIAIPIAYYFLAGWLERYEYRVEISWWIFVIAFTGALGITLLTVSFQTIKAALMSPVKSLRSE
jgi:ABC-type antimicrobial peptide transport system permease subunit